MKSDYMMTFNEYMPKWLERFSFSHTHSGHLAQEVDHIIYNHFSHPLSLYRDSTAIVVVKGKPFIFLATINITKEN